MRTAVARFGLAAVNTAVFFVEEFWVVAMVLLLPFWAAIIATTLFFSMFAVSCTKLCFASDVPAFLADWFDKQQREKESDKRVQWAIRVAKGLLWLSTLIVAIVVSPTTSALLLHQGGVKQKRAYVVDVVYSGVSAIIWCMIYGLGINIVKLLWTLLVRAIGG
jgi:hypothetical protein